jgi:predicted nuclease of restriction endonuclease-like (RecB) superfamily
LVNAALTDLARSASGLVEAPDGYGQWLADVKARVRATRFQVARSVNADMIGLYWSIGKDIIERRTALGWGAKVVERLSRDLQREFPGEGGWSVTNLKYMRMMAQAWPTPGSIGQRGVDQLPWGHVITLVTRVKDTDERDWYVARALAEGWKREILGHFIKIGLRSQLGAAPTNFATVLATPDSELAQQLVKDPYRFEHLGVVEEVSERAVEKALMDRIQDTLMEFGRGMAFVGRQLRFEVTDAKGDVDELVLDFLLFNIPQSRYVVVELKVARFQPAFLGQLAAYVGLVDDQLRAPDKHAPTIGVLLCTSKNEAIVRYTLANMTSAVGVADYEGLPTDVRAAVPSATELEEILA